MREYPKYVHLGAMVFTLLAISQVVRPIGSWVRSPRAEMWFSKMMFTPAVLQGVFLVLTYYAVLGQVQLLISQDRMILFD